MSSFSRSKEIDTIPKDLNSVYKLINSSLIPGPSIPVKSYTWIFT